MRRVFSNNEFYPEHNHTNICLIPKVYPPTGMSEFRPIAMCNVFYKIICKILINRLKTHHSSIISENQQAFIPGRVISDNIIVAHEIFHSLKVRKRQENSYMAVKTDITKAYDRLEWSFLEITMRKMGFDTKLIRWIMICVMTVTYSVMINGLPEGLIVPQRGLRQGDPLSPYIFILCVDVLSHLMHKAMEERSLMGVKIAATIPAVNHLLFAIDSLFFSLVNPKAGRKLKQIFWLYEFVSGQAINLAKSSITFGSRVSEDVKRRMRSLLGIHNDGGGHGKYLGLPVQFGRKKGGMFRYIVEKVKQITQGWSKKYLSHEGKGILVKVVALAMPIYSMNIFRLPRAICEEIHGIRAKFWWGLGEKKGIHWYAWKRVCLPKKEGGLGFRDLERFNQDLLDKQVWRIMQNPNFLMSRILKARYFANETILTAVQRKKAFYAWKSLLFGRDLLMKGLRVIIGKGSSIDMWNHAWLHVHPPRPPRGLNIEDVEAKVSNFIQEDGSGWNIDKLREFVHAEDVEEILKIKISATAEADLLG